MLRKILVADSSVSFREKLREILKNEYEVLETDNGEEAREIIRRRYKMLSAVLLEAELPKTDGLRVLEDMRKSAALGSLPVVILAESTSEDGERAALCLGANDYIAKAAAPELICQRLKNLVSLSESASIVNALSRDRLTGLYNRETFLNMVSDMVSRREPGFYVMSCFDIDKFKVINDQYGTEKGDEVLRQLAGIFRRGFEPMGGACSRIYADSFAILYPRSYLDSERLEYIRHSAAVLDGSIPPITFSTGRCILDDLSISASMMYDRAILAASTIKGRCDAHVALYNEAMRLSFIKEQRIVTEMHRALENGEFEVWFQPQYNHSTGALIGAEALARWRRPGDGWLIQPGDFIPVFERNGFVYELDKFIWDQTCAYLRKWLDEGRTPLPVSVNISRYDVFREDFFESFTGCLEKHGLSPELLRAEITESAFAEATDQIITAVKRLTDYGFTIEIDDFGCGYSSLNTLKDVPASILKLDMRFFENTEDSRRGGNIVESVVRMAKWLGMSVIAEGVETRAQAEFLKSIGCYYVQGFLYARPMPPQDYEALFDDSDRERELLTVETVYNLDNNAFWDPAALDTLIFNSYVGGACIIEYQNGKTELLRANEDYAKELGIEGFSPDSLSEMDPVNNLDGENLRLMYDNIHRAIETREKTTCELSIRNRSKPREIQHMRISVSVIARAQDRYLLYCAVVNLTGQRRAEQRERETAEHMQAILQSISSGVTAVTMDEDGSNVEFVFVTDKYYELLGYTREQYISEMTDPFGTIHMGDIPKVKAAIKELYQSGKTISCEFRAIRRDGREIWLRDSLSLVRLGAYEKPVQLSVYTDVTSEKLAADIHEEEIKFAMSQMGKMICVYDIGSKTLAVPETYAQWYGVPTTIQDVPYGEAVREALGSSYSAAYLEFYESMLRGDRSGAYDTYNKHADGQWHWEHYEFVAIYGGSGKPLKAVISVEDTTEQRETRLRYEHELQLRRELVRDCIVYYELNLSTESIVEYQTKLGDVPDMAPSVKLSEEIRKQILKNVAEEDRAAVRNTIFAKALLGFYNRGQTNVSLEYRRQLPKLGMRWVKAAATMMKKPGTDEVVAFIYIRDIDTEKKNQIALSSIVDEEIEYLCLVSVKTGMAHFVKEKQEFLEHRHGGSFRYDDYIEKLIESLVSSDDRKACRDFLYVSKLKKVLEDENTGLLTFKTIGLDGLIKRKRTLAFYLDDTREDIVLSLRDITGLYEEEQRQKEYLQNAVNAANTANAAKSDFLSRMSHDMRTPLNAILTMSGPEMTGDATAEEKDHYLEKIHTSGEYLLGIINDVLDMSKIESQKMVLELAPYSLDDFLETIETVVGESCRQKEINFHLTLEGEPVKWLMLDRTRFNQIFVNLLSNAVKFTPGGGNIDFIISKVSQSKTCLTNRYIVRDDGIGMSEEFLPRAFDSFAQEHRKNASENDQGTGLGLSIVKQLVEQMGGTIEVESAPDKGTTFTVELTYQIAEAPAEAITADDLGALQGLRILLCEDHPLNAKIAEALLVKKGCIVEHAEDGQKSVERFEISAVGYYDVILMDIRMPVMDGLEATKAIRALKRPDAKEVPILALTADAFANDEHVSLAVGMNGHLAKPIEPKLLYRLIVRETMRRKERADKDQA